MISRRHLLQHTIVGLVLSLAVTVAAHAGSQEEQRRLTPAEIGALSKGGAGTGTSGVAGIQTIVLSGDPKTAGPYTIEILVPAHTRIAAHRHRDDRAAVVVSGLWYFGYGEQADETKVKALGPGSFYTEPADTAHYALTKDDPAAVIITGFGPSDTRYIDAIGAPVRQ